LPRKASHAATIAPNPPAPASPIIPTEVLSKERQIIGSLRILWIGSADKIDGVTDLGKYRGSEAMLVTTSRFGQVQSSQEEVIIFPQGLIGFEASRHWLIVPDPDNSDVAWLQSIAQPQVALPLISPRKFVPEYKASIPNRQLVPLQLRSTDRVYVLTVVSKSGKTLTTNLRSPIIVNLTKRLACQVITNDASPLALPISLSSKPAIRVAA
jgi:flagellar assembly factor FliW